MPEKKRKRKNLKRGINLILCLLDYRLTSTLALLLVLIYVLRIVAHLVSYSAILIYVMYLFIFFQVILFVSGLRHRSGAHDCKEELFPLHGILRPFQKKLSSRLGRVTETSTTTITTVGSFSFQHTHISYTQNVTIQQ